jgi:DNA topoisomerase VI subunit B
MSKTPTSNGAVREGHRHERVAFTTSRLLEYFSEKELQVQIGFPAHAWPVALMKELIDNGLDACEAAGLPPAVNVEVGDDCFLVEDRGPGIPPEIVEAALDFSSRTSTNSRYVSPTRGQLGNAMKCVLAAPAVRFPGQGLGVTIEARGVRHRIALRHDEIAQAPTVDHRKEPCGVKKGTSVRVAWPEAAGCELQQEGGALYRPADLARAFALFNPHARVSFGGKLLLKPAPLQKWNASRPTSPHWYDERQLSDLIAAHVHRERTGQAEPMLLRDFIQNFAGLDGPSRARKVLADAGLSGLRLADLAQGDNLDRERVSALLGAMQDAARPIRPEGLGAVGKDNWLRAMAALYSVEEEGRYCRKLGVDEHGRPYVVEAVLGHLPEECGGRVLRVGLNWSPALKVPHDAIHRALASAMVSANVLAFVGLHIITPLAGYTDRGKAHASLPYEVVCAVLEALKYVTAPVTDFLLKQLRRREKRAAQEEKQRAYDADAQKRADRAAVEARRRAAAAGAVPEDATPLGRLKRLQQETGVSNLDDLIALSRKNDPFACGTPGHIEEARWFAELWGKYSPGSGVHLRRFHYTLVSQKPRPPKPDGSPYGNTEEDWTLLQEASKYARYLGLVPAGDFTDRRNDPAVVNYRPEETPEPRCDLVEIPGWSLPVIDTNLSMKVDLALPAVTVDGYGYRPCDQPYHLEVWIEKSTMDDILGPLCQELGVNLQTSVGFQTVTGVINLLKRVEELARVLGGRPCRVFYISDFDPAGDFMPQAVARQVEFWLAKLAPAADIKLCRLALTAEQCQHYNLPRIPIKAADARRGSFEQRNGVGATELDALEALHPGVLARIVREAVEPYRDEGLADALADAQAEAQEQAEGAWQEATQPEREALEEIRREAARVTSRFEGRAAALNAEMQASLEPLRIRLEAVRRAAEQKRNAFKADLPARPEAGGEEPDESEWLYDSDRDYLEQLAVYKEKMGKPAVATEAPGPATDADGADFPRACAECGGEITGKKGAQYCSTACRMRAYRARGVSKNGN